jgi:hypothetical protein
MSVSQIFNNPIIPSKVLFSENSRDQELDYAAICIFATTGFFLGNETFYKGKKSLIPGHKYSLINGRFVDRGSYFNWKYNPHNRNFSDVVDEFQSLFETIISEQSGNQKVILPLSGGLDSRTQAAALKRIGASVSSYSYEFQDGYPEAAISKKIADLQGFEFRKFVINPGYLWSCIDELAAINCCYAEFTHPRQMAVTKELGGFGDVFNLGHWGDVLFDDMGVQDDLSFHEQVDVILKKIIKKGGLELGDALWREWSLSGTLLDCLRSKVEVLLARIDIPHSANARIRAFKSLYWAPRWTSVNLAIFENIRPIQLPYYDNRMCEFITSVPEIYLSKRKIQIEYLKRYSPSLAKIVWQENKPFNLINYHWNKAPYNIPYRLFSKLKRTVSPREFIQRNWELQFLGKENNLQLNERLFQEESHLFSKSLVKEFYYKFQNVDAIRFSHSLSMLLTLKSWEKIEEK